MSGDRVYKGDIECDCGKDAPIFLTGGGMLTYSCGWCRFQGHAAKGSPSFRRMQSKIKAGFDDEAPKMQTVETEPKTEPKTKEVEKTIFDIFKAKGD